MVRLQNDIKQIEEAGITLVAISYDSIETLKKWADKNGTTFPLLSDEGSKTIDAYGIRNKEMDGVKFGKNDLTGIPHPGTYIVDSKGVIRDKIFLERYQVRHTPEQLIAAAAKIK